MPRERALPRDRRADPVARTRERVEERIALGVDLLAARLLEDFAQFPDAGVMLVKGYKSDAIGTNRAGYSNPEVDKLLDEALATGDEKKRCDLYSQVQTILDKDSVMIDMYGVYKPAVYRVGTIAELKASMLATPAEPADFRLAKK